MENLVSSQSTVSRNQLDYRTLFSAFRGKRVAVFGHTGFKGSWLSLWLTQLGAEVSGFSLDPTSDPALFELANLSGLMDDVRGDIRDYDAVLSYLQSRKPEIIFHLAAQPIVRLSYQQPKMTFDTNVGGTVNVLEAARQCPSVQSIIVVTSDKCYENREWNYSYRENDPLGGYDPYSASKGAAEIVTASYRNSFFTSGDVCVVSARAGNVIGGGDWAPDRILPDAVRAILAGQKIPVRNPLSVRPWQHVLEPLSGYLLLAEKSLGASRTAIQSAWNFGPYYDEIYTVRDVVETFLHAYGSGDWDDLSKLQTTAPHETKMLLLAWDKARVELGWKPRWKVNDAITRTGVWYRRQASGESARELCLEEIREYMG